MVFLLIVIIIMLVLVGLLMVIGPGWLENYESVDTWTSWEETKKKV